MCKILQKIPNKEWLRHFGLIIISKCPKTQGNGTFGNEPSPEMSQNPRKWDIWDQSESQNVPKPMEMRHLGTSLAPKCPKTNGNGTFGINPNLKMSKNQWK